MGQRHFVSFKTKIEIKFNFPWTPDNYIKINGIKGSQAVPSIKRNKTSFVSKKCSLLRCLNLSRNIMFPLNQQILNSLFWYVSAVEYNLNYGQDLDMEERKDLTLEIKAAKIF